MITFTKDLKIYLDNSIKNKVINHCFRKLHGNYTEHETHEQQAYGLLAGRIDEHKIMVNDVFTSKKNYRNHTSIQYYINDLVNRYAIASDTPINARGWVMHPDELLDAYQGFDQNGIECIGSYHMHHQGSWRGNTPKEYPSLFDVKLANDSNLIMFIVSVYANEQCTIKAFYNGLKQCEIEVVTVDIN